MAGVFNLKCGAWFVLTANFQWHVCDKGGEDATERAGEGQGASTLGLNIAKIVFDHTLCLRIVYIFLGKCFLFLLTQVNQTNTDSQPFNKRHTTYRLNVSLRTWPKQEFLQNYKSLPAFSLVGFFFSGFRFVLLSL